MPRRHPRMPPHVLILQMILAVALTSGSMLAAAVDPTEEIPIPKTEQTVDPRWQERSIRAENFKAQFLSSRKSIEAGHATERKLQTKRAETRRDCRESVRKANRDQRFTKIAACMHEDFTLMIEMIKVRSEIIAATTGISKELRGLIIARSDLLTDATSTIVDAIDAGVYQDEAGLLEARKNLREKYLLPYWSLLPQMKTDAVLTWVSHLLLRARALTESGDLPSAVAAKITEAEVCLVDTEATLKTVAGEKDLQKMNTIISQARSAAISCIKLYRDAVTLENTELTPLEEVPIEPQWQKRSLRKLPKSRY